MVGIDPETDFSVGPWLKDNLDGELGRSEVILGSNAHIFFGKSESNIGDIETFYGNEFVVVGILEPTGLGLDDGGFITLEAAHELAQLSEITAERKLEVEPGQISTLMIKVEPGADRGDVARAIADEVPGIAVVSSKELMTTSVSRQLETLTPGLLIIGGGFWIIAVLLIGALFTMVINERRRELGLLQAMGATRSFIFKLVMLESIQLTALGGAIGLAIGAVIILVLKSVVVSSLGVEFQWPSAGFIIGFTLGYLVLAVATGVIAALYPAAVASRLEPYQAIRSGE